MPISSAIRALVEGRDLSPESMTAAMAQIMGGEATPAQIGAFLVGLRIKGETVAEITAAARVMRRLVTPVEVSKAYLVDTCGTGGDGANTFNISTVSAFVAAAAGARVAKHGNRSVSSRSGSADLLEDAGVKIDLTPDQVARCIEEVGIGFMFAPRYHGAMKHAIGPRRELGIRTIFNLLGPLTNPAGAPNQVLGVYDDKWLKPMAEVLKNLGSRSVMVVHAADGLDEISISAGTRVAELRNGEIRTYAIAPEEFGLRRGDPSEIRADNVAKSLALMDSVLDNRPGAALDVVLLNAGAAIYVAGQAGNLSEGIQRAREVIGEGRAQQKLTAFVEFTNRF